MCPLRFILIFFSAVLAAYFAWKSVGSSAGADEDSIPTQANSSAVEEQHFHFLKMIQKGFWGFVDMASGRYLWRNINQLNAKTS